MEEAIPMAEDSEEDSDNFEDGREVLDDDDLTMQDAAAADAADFAAAAFDSPFWSPNLPVEKFVHQQWKKIVPEVFPFTPELVLSSSSSSSVVSTDAYERLFKPLERFICDEDPATGFSKFNNDDHPPELCGKVFKDGEATYLCRDCGMDPTCVLCIDCFNRSAHKKHRYRMATSGGGGYCDCGDTEAWKNDAFCDYHARGRGAASEGDEAHRGKLPQDVRSRADTILSLCLDYCYILMFWEGLDNLPEAFQPETLDDSFLAMLYNDEVHTYNHVTEALQRACNITEKQATEHAARVDREGRSPVRVAGREECDIVKKEIQRRSGHTLHGARQPLKVEVCHVLLASHQSFALAILVWLRELSAKAGAGLRDLVSEILLRQQISGLTIVERFILGETKLWKGVRHQLHQLLMATVLMEANHKKAFSLIFAKHYSRIQRDFVEDDHDHNLSVTSLSVQMLTVPTLAKMLIAESDLLSTIFQTFWRELTPKINKDGMLSFSRPGRGGITSEQFNRRSTFVLLDPKYVLTTPPNPEEWESPKLRANFLHGLEILLQILSSMQGMDPVKRFTDHHIEYEPEWDSAFNLQLKLQNVVNHIISWAGSFEGEASLLVNAFRITVDALCYWNDNSSLTRVPITLAKHTFLAIDYDVSKSPVSIHLPLTRLLAGLYLHLGKFGLTYYSPELMMQSPSAQPHRLDPIDLMEYPLRVLVLDAQTYAGLWRRNGYSLLNQLFLYKNVRCRGEMFDRDVQLLQICASLLDPNEFLIQVINRFGLLTWIRRSSSSSAAPPAPSRPSKQAEEEEEHKLWRDMAEEMLTLLVVILTERFVQGIGRVSRDDCVQREVAHVLCSGPKTHSEILKSLHEDANRETGFDEVVDQVASFNNASKKYSVRDDRLDRFSMFYYHFSRSEQTKAEEEMGKRLRAAAGADASMSPPQPPPFAPTLVTVIRLFDCDVMMMLLQSVFFCAFETKSPTWFSETHLLRALHLMLLALHEQQRGVDEGDSSLQFLAKSEELEWVFRPDPVADCSPSPLPSSHFPRHSLSSALDRLHADPRYESLRDLIAATRRRLANITRAWRRLTSKAASTESSAADGEEREEKEEREEEENGGAKEEEEERKKRAKALANERRAKIMAQMASMQRAFIAENKDAFDAAATDSAAIAGDAGDAGDEPMTETAPDFPVAVGRRKTSCLSGSRVRQEICILCQEQEDVSLERLTTASAASTSSSTRSGVMVMTALVQRSNVLATTTTTRGDQSRRDDPLPDAEGSSSSNSCLSTSRSSSSSFLKSKGLVRSSLPRSSASGSAIGGAAGPPAAAAAPNDDDAAFSSTIESKPEAVEDPLFASSSFASGCHVSSCGHVMHAECWQSYFDAVIQKEQRRRQRYPSTFDVEKNFFLCPLCETLSNAAVPILPLWSLEASGSIRADDDFPSWQTRLLHVVESSLRVRPKPAPVSNLLPAIKRQIAGLWRVRGLRRLVYRRDPPEGGEGGPEDLAALGRSVRRRATSSPGALDVDRSEEDLTEEPRSEPRSPDNDEVEWELAPEALDEEVERMDDEWTSFLESWREVGYYGGAGMEVDGSEAPSLHPTLVLMQQNLVRATFIVGLNAMPDDEDHRMITSARTALAYTIRSAEALARTPPSTHFPEMSASRSLFPLPSAAAAAAAAPGLSSRQLDFLRVLARSTASSSTVAAKDVSRRHALRLLSSLLPLSEDVESRLPPTPRQPLDLEPFTALVNLVLAAPTLLSAGDSVASPPLPSCGANDRALLRLVSALHVAQILAWTNLDAAETVADGMEVEGEAEGGASEEEVEEKKRLLSAWELVRTLAHRSTLISSDFPSRDSAADFLFSSTHRTFLPYLRCAALFFHLLTDVPMPTGDEEACGAEAAPAAVSPEREFRLLLQYLDLPPLDRLVADADAATPSPLRRWCWWTRAPTPPSVENSSSIEGGDAASGSKEVEGRLDDAVPLLFPPTAALRRLISLPLDYSDLINAAASYVCPSAASGVGLPGEGRSPMLCLTCGVMLCSAQTICCQTEIEGRVLGPCNSHARECGVGVGVLLQMSKCQIVLLSGGDRGCFYPAPYVDAYGETDQGLRRGNPLFLCQESFEKLENLWLNHEIPQTIARALEVNSNLMAITWNMW